jgi:hypothetical protein
VKTRNGSLARVPSSLWVAGVGQRPARVRTWTGGYEVAARHGLDWGSRIRIADLSRHESNLAMGTLVGVLAP